AGSGAAVVDAFASLSVVDLKVQDDLTVGDDIIINSDSAVVSFGVDGDTTLTHTDGTGLTLNSTNKLCFNDASQFIQGASATVLDIAATDEIELTATLIDVVGNITNSGTIVSTGKITSDAGIDIDNFNIDGTTIALSSGDMTLDGAADIILDAAGDEVIFKDGSTNVGHVSMDSDNLTIKSLVSDKDIILQGNDGGSGITALTLDMSAAGAATFNNDVTAFSDKRLKTDVTDIENALDKVQQMQGVYYRRNDVENAKMQVGVLAQDMEKILPEVVLTADDEMQTKSVDYGKITSVLIEAVKELSAKVKELEGK
ncbi:tail fiber domain-containing protein, partial [bacterium]|nr:tail fiber domain-containing protein [bacterium]